VLGVLSSLFFQRKAKEKRWGGGDRLPIVEELLIVLFSLLEEVLLSGLCFSNRTDSLDICILNRSEIEPGALIEGDLIEVLVVVFKSPRQKVNDESYKVEASRRSRFKLRSIRVVGGGMLMTQRQRMRCSSAQLHEI
jgi:hypothetical protein